MSGILSQAEIDSGRAWSQGKSYGEIAQGAKANGYNAAQVAAILGLSEAEVAGSGYGSASGLNSATASGTWTPAPAPAPAQQATIYKPPSPAPAPAPAVTAPPPLAPTSATPAPVAPPKLEGGYGTSASRIGLEGLKSGWADMQKTADPYKAAYDHGRSQGWNSTEMAAALNAASGTNNYSKDIVDQYTWKNYGGILTTGNALNDYASEISASALRDWGKETDATYADVYNRAAKDGLGAAHAAEALRRAAGVDYEGALANVDEYGTKIKAGTLRADADWAREKSIGDMRLINRDMQVNGMFAEDAAEQIGIGINGAELNAMFERLGLPPLQMRDPSATNKPPSTGTPPQGSQQPSPPGQTGDPKLTVGTPSINREVNAGSDTIEGRLGNLLGVDSRGRYTNQVVRQAADRAMQQMASRGLLNSSMAEQAAQEAAISKAIEIAGPDAQTYFAQGRANQDAANVFARDERGYTQDQLKLDKQLQLEREKMNKQFDLNYAQLDLDREKLTMSGSQFNQELKYKYDSLNINSADRAAAEALAHKNALEINSITSVNSAYDLYLRRISDIDNNAEYSAEAKVQMKNQAGKDFDIYARAKGIALEMDLGNRFSAASGVAALPKPVAGMLASQGDYGQGGA